MIRSLGGWPQVLSLRDRREKVSCDVRILGRGDFVNRIMSEADGRLRRQLQIGDRKKTADELIRKICRDEDIGEDELRVGSQRKKVSKLRGKLSYRFSHELGMSMAEIGRYLGVCTSAVYKAIQHYESGMQK